MQPGDTVLVENPGYFLMFDGLRRQGVRMVPIPRTPEGLDLPALEAACVAHRPRLLVMQTVLHNPTGWSSTAANLHRVLVLARQHGLLIAEDDVQGHFYAGHAPRLASLSGLDGVMYISSFCKALSPALRMGYVAAEPALLKVLLREKICSVLTTAALNEYVLLEVLAAGRWRKHLDRLQAKLLKARIQCARQLTEAGILLDHPGEGGLFLWGKAPDGVDVDELVQDAVRNQILLVRGTTFSADQGFGRHLRFNVVLSQQPRLAQYLKTRFASLAQGQGAVQRALRSPAPSPSPAPKAPT